MSTSNLSQTSTDLPNNSNKYTDKLIALQASFPGMLTQYQRDFVTYNINPVDTNPTQSIFFSDRQNIQNAFNNLFQVIGNLQADMKSIDVSTNSLNDVIKNDKQKYAELSHNLDLYTGKVDTANVMKDDYSKLYFNTFVSNISLFAGICLIFAVMFHVFRKQKYVPSPSASTSASVSAK